MAIDANVDVYREPEGACRAVQTVSVRAPKRRTSNP